MYSNGDLEAKSAAMYRIAKKGDDYMKYVVVTETSVNGERMNDVVGDKVYKSMGWARREAKKINDAFFSKTEKGIKKTAYVMPVVRPATYEEAKREYCRSNPVWVDGEYGKVKLFPSGCYGSHAPASELFHRGVDDIVGWWMDHTEVNYYVTEED